MRRAVSSLRAEPEAAEEPEAVAAPAADPILQALERGRNLDQVLIGQVRALLGDGEHDRADSIATSLRRHPETEELGRVAGGIVAYRRGYPELAWHHLRAVPREAWTRFAAAEYARAGLAVAPEEALREIRALSDDDPPELRAKLWFDLLAPVFGHGDGALARDLFERFDRHVREDRNRWAAAETHRGWMRPWVAHDPDSPTAPATGRRTFAIMDYGHPSANKASANIGDHVQSVASLGHLVRHQGVRLHGREELVGVLERLRERTRPERRLSGVEAELDVITVHRDASMYEAIPEDTWTLCFGWFMHALFGMRHGFPLHRNLRPIFVSFHCNKRGLLTPDAVEYLRRYGPVGCRDWNTVHLLQSIGVESFFSGCLTTTIDSVFPEAPEPPRDAPLAYVDLPAPDGAVGYEHSDEAVRTRPFVANVERALELLETYRRDHRGVVTSRLHCYLPVRAIGVDVEFRPANRSDIRFEGLIDLDDEAFGAMAAGISAKLKRVVGAILAGRPEDEVYALWRELCAGDVATAEERRRLAAALPPADLAADVEAARAEAVMHGTPPDPVHCAIVMPKGAGTDVSVLVASLREHASRPLQLWILGLRGTRGIDERLAEQFPDVAVGWLPVRHLGETAARLLVADLLPDVDRLIVLPLPSVATGDVAELAGLDLGGHALAAATRPGNDVSGFGVIHAAALRLGDRTDASAALRRTAHARHAFDFDAFTHDVLVLDLARLRDERFGARALELVEAYELDDVEAMHYLVGPRRAELAPRWAVVPTRMPVAEPGLIHWADGVKPDQPELVAERERWRAYRAS
jgi:hypothetical protein